MKKKILYLFSDTGGGHSSAVTAMTAAVSYLKPDIYLQEKADVFATCSGFLNIFARLYGPVIKYWPAFWGGLYYWLHDEKRLYRLEKMASPFIMKRLTQFIQERAPDVIVSVHPMINHLTVTAIKRSGKKVPFVMVITDPVTLHRAWITPEVELCVVATPAAREIAIKHGMPPEKIKVIGMPIDPKFISQTQKKQSGRAKTHDKFTVLLMGGGEGAGKMEEIIRELNRQKLDIKLIAIAGRNKILEAKLRGKIDKVHFPMEVYGFTDRVHEIMAESDLIITKAGPGTIAEALAMGLPIIITSWLPGQEEGNVEFVVQEKVGCVSKDPQKVAQLVRELQGSPQFEEMKENTKRISRPQAALEIAQQIFAYL